MYCSNIIFPLRDEKISTYQFFQEIQSIFKIKNYKTQNQMNKVMTIL